MAANNHSYETPDFNLAVFLHSKNVTFRCLQWPTPQRAVFVFDEPPSDVLLAWMKDEGVFVRKYMDSRNYLRDVLEGKRN
jgi:hypothetical protein